MKHRDDHRNKAIGIFDSGIGGLTVAAEIFKILPNENVIYFGDTGRYPYGPRSPEIVRRFARQDVNFLLEKGVKFIVIACNTASAAALDYIKKIYNIPMIGVIEPGASAAIASTKNRRVGVIGTTGTINSSSYTKALINFDSSLKITVKACPLFVPIVEEAYTDRPAAKMIAEDYLADFRTKNIDTLILGCTHYPLMKKLIGSIVGTDVKLIDSAESTAVAAKQALTEADLLNQKNSEGKKNFYVSDSPDKFKMIAKQFLGKRLSKVELIDINSY